MSFHDFADIMIFRFRFRFRFIFKLKWYLHGTSGASQIEIKRKNTL